VREVDEEDHGDRDEADPDHAEAEPAAIAASAQHSEDDGEKAERNQQVGVRLARRADVDGGRLGDTRQPGVAGLPYLHPAVVDEL
jgi:hypothetical protein